MDIEEIRIRITEMGISAGQGQEENSKLLYSLLVALNGSGLAASLAFIGTILNSKLNLGYVPFYWCVICFGMGLTAGFISLLFNYLYFRMAVSRYEREYLAADATKITTAEHYIPILIALSTPTCGMKTTAWLNRYLPVLSATTFAVGLFFGIYYLHILRAVF